MVKGRVPFICFDALRYKALYLQLFSSDETEVLFIMGVSDEFL